jgi:hypothetical protein
MLQWNTLDLSSHESTERAVSTTGTGEPHWPYLSSYAGRLAAGVPSVVRECRSVGLERAQHRAHADEFSVWPVHCVGAAFLYVVYLSSWALPCRAYDVMWISSENATACAAAGCLVDGLCTRMNDNRICLPAAGDAAFNCAAQQPALE